MKLPIGQSDFKKIIDQKYNFVDKTLFIKEIIDEPAAVILITRPRRFGKTFNLSMLKYFFAEDVNSIPTQGLFEGLKISRESVYAEYQGQHPVVSLSFKDVKEDNFASAYKEIYSIIIDLYEEFSYLQESASLSKTQKDFYNRILTREADETDLAKSLKSLTEYLFFHHRQQPIVLIDEYDTPIHAGYLNGFYDEIVTFFRKFFSKGLKDNTLLHKAVLTGILRVSRESLFSGLNHLDVFSVLSPRYSSYFGFTEPEVIELLTQAKMEEKLIEVKDCYNGYHMGKTTLYNPWSIINFIQKGGILQPYWVNTSDNDLIKTLLSKSSVSFKDTFEALLQGNVLEKLIDENIVFSDLKTNNPTSIWSLFLMTGYLTTLKHHLTPQGSLCTLSIPNKEVSFLFQRIIEQWFSGDYGLDWYNEFLDYLLTGNIERFSQELKQLMELTVSVHDTGRSPEAFYHGLMVGLTASLHASPVYEIKSNRESGSGRYDYAIISREAQKLSIIMEFKQVKEPEGRTLSDSEMTELLKKTAETALAEISEKSYCTEIKQRGLTRVLKIGLAFSGKKFCLVHVLSGVSDKDSV
ncbi:MAG TPA: AAA family ATPase [Alphaproteobacteria bacterium]|nr:AAA family ATPase [Alphaproteobacteria bacterium]HQS93360.1 AAA family ATPase [Alphaproteobacteria bacterium]